MEAQGNSDMADVVQRGEAHDALLGNSIVDLCVFVPRLRIQVPVAIN